MNTFFLVATIFLGAVCNTVSSTVSSKPNQLRRLKSIVVESKNNEVKKVFSQPDEDAVRGLWDMSHSMSTHHGSMSGSMSMYYGSMPGSMSMYYGSDSEDSEDYHCYFWCSSSSESGEDGDESEEEGGDITAAATELLGGVLKVANILVGKFLELFGQEADQDEDGEERF